jgi:hypothetical protein
MFPPLTHTHTLSLALIQNSHCRFQKAEAKFLEALAEARLGFDKMDPHIASCLNNIAEFYRNTRQYAKAEPLYKEVRSDLVSSECGRDRKLGLVRIGTGKKG